MLLWLKNHTYGLFSATRHVYANAKLSEQMQQVLHCSPFLVKVRLVTDRQTYSLQTDRWTNDHIYGASIASRVNKIWHLMTTSLSMFYPRECCVVKSLNNNDKYIRENGENLQTPLLRDQYYL